MGHGPADRAGRLRQRAPPLQCNGRPVCPELLQRRRVPAPLRARVPEAEVPGAGQQRGWAHRRSRPGYRGLGSRCRRPSSCEEEQEGSSTKKSITRARPKSSAAQCEEFRKGFKGTQEQCSGGHRGGRILCRESTDDTIGKLLQRGYKRTCTLWRRCGCGRVVRRLASFLSSASHLRTSRGRSRGVSSATICRVR